MLRKPFNKHRNYVVSPLRNEKENFSTNLDTKVVTENTVFWKIVKPFLFEKATKQSRVTLLKMIKSFLVTTRVLKGSVNTHKYPNFKYAK